MRPVVRRGRERRRAVDDRVDAAVLCVGQLLELHPGVALRHVGHARDALAAVGVDLGAELLDLRVDIDHDDLRALLAEELGRLVADAAGSARDDGHFSFESIHYFVLLSLPSSRR